MQKLGRFAAFVVLFGVLNPLAHGQQRPLVSTTQVRNAYGQLPMRFEENRGQSDERVRFLTRGAGYAFFITNDEAVAVLRGSGAKNERAAVVRMRLKGANRRSRPQGTDLLPGISNYFTGSDSSKWRTNVPQYARVTLPDVYRGIDVVYYGNQRQLEYDFIVKPGADPRAIRLHFDGAERIDIDDTGDLVLHVSEGELRQHVPRAYQERGGVRNAISASYRRLNRNEFAIDLGQYDRSRPVVVDPVLVYATFLGGATFDFALGIAVDGSGNAYVTGLTDSADFPTVNPYQANQNNLSADAFVAKFNASGTALVYSTFLGGSGAENDTAIAVDSAGNAYVAGDTTSTDFPTVSPKQGSNGGGSDVFVAKLNPAGSALVYSTYLGGSGDESLPAIAVDSSGNAYVAGSTDSINFPTASALQPSNGGGLDGFVTKFNASGSAHIYSTYLGGSAGDGLSAIAVDASGNAYVAGLTQSPNYPTASPLQGACGGCSGANNDAVVSKINPTGSALVYSTYLGGLGDDYAHGIAVDSSGNAYLIGSTDSTNFPTASPFQANNGGGLDLFLAKVSAAGSALTYSTYLGGSLDDVGLAVAVDSDGNAYITGYTNSADFPSVNPLQVPDNGDVAPVFVTKMNAAGSALLYSTQLFAISGQGIAVDSLTNAYVAGIAGSKYFPLANPFQSTISSADGFVAKLSTIPFITHVLPNEGPTGGGQSVTIRGGNLSGATSVTFGGVAAVMGTNSGTSIAVTTPSHTSGAVDVVAVIPAGNATMTGGYTYGVTALAAPTGLTATAISTAQVNLSWTAVGGATGYRIDRMSTGGAGFVQIASSATNSFSDANVLAGRAYLYSVRAITSTEVSAGSAPDLASTFALTDSPLTAGTLVKAVHLAELRTSVDAVRALANLSAGSYTDPATAGMTVKAIHLTEIRTALDAARSILGLATGGYTDSSLSGIRVKAVHWQELRNRTQ